MLAAGSIRAVDPAAYGEPVGLALATGPITPE